jgi:hypothetical protein
MQAEKVSSDDLWKTLDGSRKYFSSTVVHAARVSCATHNVDVSKLGAFGFCGIYLLSHL